MKLYEPPLLPEPGCISSEPSDYQGHITAAGWLVILGVIVAGAGFLWA